MNVNESNESSSNKDGLNAESNKGNESSSNEDGLNAESNKGSESSSQEDDLNAENNEGNEGIDPSMFGLPIMVSNMFNNDHVATGSGVVDWRAANLPRYPFRASERHAFKETDEGSKELWGDMEDEDEDDSSSHKRGQIKNDPPNDPDDGVTTDEEDDKSNKDGEGLKPPTQKEKKGPRPSTRIGSDGLERRIVNVPALRDPSETAWTQRLSENGLSDNALADGVGETTPPALLAHGN
jgi:hypothetical protein